MNTQSEFVRWSRDEFSWLITGVMHENGWFNMHRALILKLGFETAGVLHYLINLHARVQQSPGYRWNGGWFFCKTDKMLNEIGLSRKAQWKNIRKLVGEHLLRSEQRGIPAVRWLRIDCLRIAEIIRDWARPDPETGGQVSDGLGTPSCSQLGTTRCSQTGTPYTSKKKASSKIPYPSSKEEGYGEASPATPASPRHPGVPSSSTNTTPTNGRTLPCSCRKRAASQTKKEKKEKKANGFFATEFDHKAAGHLREVLVKHDDDLVVPSSGRMAVGLDSLAKSIQRLRTERKVSEPAIKDMIRWLKHHYGEEFVPRLRRADGLCVRWRSFVEARQRWLSDNGEEPGAEKAADGKTKGGADIVVACTAYEIAYREGRNPWEGGLCQEHVDEALRRLKRPPGSVRVRQCWGFGFEQQHVVGPDGKPGWWSK